MARGLPPLEMQTRVTVSPALRGCLLLYPSISGGPGGSAKDGNIGLKNKQIYQKYSLEGRPESLQLTLDKHLDEGSERLLGQGWMLGLASDVGEVIPGCGPKPQHRGHGLPVGEAALVLAVLTATCKDIELQ